MSEGLVTENVLNFQRFINILVVSYLLHIENSTIISTYPSYYSFTYHSRLAYLNEPGVLQNLFARFSLNEIYVRGPAYYDALRQYSQFISCKLRNQCAYFLLSDIQSYAYFQKCFLVFLQWYFRTIYRYYGIMEQHLVDRHTQGI